MFVYHHHQVLGLDRDSSCLGNKYSMSISLDPGSRGRTGEKKTKNILKINISQLVSYRETRNQ